MHGDDDDDIAPPHLPDVLPPPPVLELPKLPTPELRERPIDEPPHDPIVALQAIGTGHQLALAPSQMNFAIGSGQPPSVDVSVAGIPGSAHVSELHAYLSRRGNTIDVTDRSRNGTYFNSRRVSHVELLAGKAIRLAELRLLALDEPMRALRPHLLWALGLDAHDAVDDALMNLADGDGVLLLGPPECEQRALSEAIHATSARRGRALVVADPPLQHRAEETATLQRGSGSAVFLDLHTITPLAWFVDQLFGTTYHVRPIIAAPSVTDAENKLGAARARRLRMISIPAVADRRAEIPRLLQALIKRSGVEGKLGDLGVDNVAALVTNHKWKRNFFHVREAARRIGALIEAQAKGRSQSDAAASLGLPQSTLSSWLSGLGLRWQAADS